MMFSKINVLKIFRDHFSTLHRYKEEKVSIRDVCSFYIFPLFLSLLIGYVLDISLKKELVHILITSFSIFAALLFNLLILVYDIIVRWKRGTQQVSEVVVKFLEEIYINISYSILISVASVVVLILNLFNMPTWLATVVNVVSFYFLIHFLLTLLMILKRVHILLRLEFK